MENMSVEEMKAMVGTEFKYVFSDGAELHCVVAAFDPDVGLTCLATCLTDSAGRGWDDRVDGNGNLCMLGYNDVELTTKNKEISFILRSIKHLGHYVLNSDFGFGRQGEDSSGGSPFCSF